MALHSWFSANVALQPDGADDGVNAAALRRTLDLVAIEAVVASDAMRARPDRDSDVRTPKGSLIAPTPQV